MELDQAIKYVKKYRFNGRSCYVRAADRGVHIFDTPKGQVEFRCHAQSNDRGNRSKTKYCAYLIWHTPGGTGKPVPSKQFANLL